MADDKTVQRGRFVTQQQARVLAMQALALFDALGDDFHQQLPAFLRDPENAEDIGLQAPVADDVLTLARALATGAWTQRGEVDRLITEVAPNWSLARLSPVDRNVLRLAAFELRRYPETPAAVVFNEAIELARRFGGADSAAFVNGVLDAVRKRMAATPAADANAANATGEA